MRLETHKHEAIRDIVRDRMVQSGVDNYSFVNDRLQIGSSQYTVEVCGCGDADCDGLRLSRVPYMHGFPAGGAKGTA